MVTLQIKDSNGVEWEYHVSPVRAGQMRDLADARRKLPDPTQAFLDENMMIVTYCLQNAGTQKHSGGEFEITKEHVELLEYPIYKRLLDIAQEVSGFVEKIAGEAPAA